MLKVKLSAFGLKRHKAAALAMATIATFRASATR
jgi:hypothetical protein